MIEFLNGLFTAAGGALLAPFRPLGPWAAMIAVSLLTGVLMLLIFKTTSNQAAILRTKNLIKAHLLELRLYKHNFGQTMKSQGGILLANGRYLGHAIRPMLVMLVPILLLLLQLDLRFGARSLRVGETVLVKVKLDPEAAPVRTPVALEASAGLIVETPPLRIDKQSEGEDNEINWRVRASAAGFHELKFVLDGGSFSESVAVERAPLTAIVPLRLRSRGLAALGHPGGTALPGGLPVAAVEVAYPADRLSLFGWRMHWLVAFFGLSVIFGFALKGVFKVEV